MLRVTQARASVKHLTHHTVQLQANGQDRYQNLGAVAVLRGPEWDDPDFVQFEAVHPRPDVAATYEACPCPHQASACMAKP